MSELIKTEDDDHIILNEHKTEEILTVKNTHNVCIKLIIYSITLSLLIISFFFPRNKLDKELTPNSDNNSNNNQNNNLLNQNNKTDIPINNKTDIPINSKTDIHINNKADIPVNNKTNNPILINNITNTTNDKNASSTKNDKTEDSKNKDIPKIERKTSYTLKDYQNFVKIAKEGKFLYKENLEYSEKPLISVIIALYNAEKFINATLKSVQNQRMKEIEIILVDDYSQDKSLLYAEAAQKIDPRIVILKNKKNMAIFYTKSIGVFVARGNYIFSLDDDDFLLVDDLFEIIYEESTTKNYDILEYRWIDSKSYDLNERYISMRPFCVHNEGQEIFQPELRRRFNRNEKGQRQLPDRFIWGRLIVKDVYLKAVGSVDKEDLARRFTEHDDTITTFLLFKFASSFKKMGKVGLCHFWSSSTSSAESERWKPERILNTCLSFLNYVYILYKYSEKDKKAREEAFWALRIWVINSNCKTYKGTLDITIDLVKRFYADPLIDKSMKNEIKRAFPNYVD